MAPHLVPSPLSLDLSVHPPTPRRPESCTVGELNERDSSVSSSSSFANTWTSLDAIKAGPLLSVPRRRVNTSNGSTSSLASSAGNASDSAYGTLDEREGDEETEGCFSPVTEANEESGEWKDRLAETFQERSKRRVQAALGAEGWRLRTKSENGDGVYWRRRSGLTATETAQSSPDVPQAGVFSFDLAYDADSSFDSLDSFPTPFTPFSATSSRSSPEPSECGESDGAGTRLTIPRRRRKLLSPSLLEESGSGLLARRHTLPRRGKAREAPVKVSFVPALKRENEPTPASPPTASSPLPSSSSSTPLPSSHLFTLPPLTQTVAILTALISTASSLSRHPLVTPISPVHLRHASTFADLTLQLSNAALAPFLITRGLKSAALGAVNLALLRSLEESTPALSPRSKVALAGGMWAAIVGLRILAGWVFGRVLGWAHPEHFSTRAIHEVGAGLGPLLLALYLLYSASHSSAKPPSFVPAALSAASFATPVSNGGAGLWLGLCGAVVGLAASLVFAAYSTFSSRTRSRTPSSSSTCEPASSFSLLHFLTLLTLPSLAVNAVSPNPKAATTSATFSQLHPSQDNLLTVLLMTAPRPGNPDFLQQTVSSWLGAFPDPDSSVSDLSLSLFSNSTTVPALSSRLRLVVYTHFASHPQFDLAQSTFSSSPKASHYITWQRDSRALAAGNRLDQRLHVARGLEYAAGLGGAYVLLTEDDFPLCEDGGNGESSWSGAWEKLQAALVKTNELMPDVFASSTPGHCGLFLSTGGSGLAIRTPIAALLPSLLLGASDPHGYAREAAAARGQLPAQVGGKDADTPDLVIQDCLRGRLEECRALCAPAANGGEGPFVQGSARVPGGVPGERRGKSGLAGTERLLQRHLGYNASTLPGREYGREEWACGWRQPFNGEPDVLTV
ncbi:hypothetical protein JCM8547_009392 [Rhodosporidiobolus lusitaniae]